MMPETPIANGYTALPPGGSGPGIVLCHAWWGLNDDFRVMADRLAEAGYVVLAPDLWGGVVARDIDEAEELLTARDDAALFGAVSAALAELVEHPAVQPGPIGMIGYSMGAAWALYLSGLHKRIGAVVGFYGNGEGDFAAARAAYQLHFATGDTWEPEEGIVALADALRAAGRAATFYAYDDVAHWFMEPGRPEYNASAAGLAWERTLAFLAEYLADAKLA